MAGLLITLSGPDGVGKTTQARLLVDHLVREGHRARTFWYRPGYSKELDTARALVRRVARRALPSADEPEARARAFRRPGVSGAWLALATADTFVQLGAKLRFWLTRGEIVVCDRYLLDARLDLELRFPEQRDSIRRLWRWVEGACPRADRAFVLEATAARVEERRASKHEPFPDEEDTRQARHLAYAELVSAGDARALDADSSLEDVQSRLREAVADLLVP